MFNELPNYVFHKSYENFYLMTEFDIIFNDEFTKKIDVLLEQTNSDKLLIELEVPDEYSLLVRDKIEISRKDNLNSFYEMVLDVDGNELPCYMMNFFIYDSSMKWEIYVSLENELSILACSKEIISIFETILNPYENEDIEKKYKIIGDMFTDKKAKLDFIDCLEKNYNFRNKL